MTGSVYWEAVSRHGCILARILICGGQGWLMLMGVFGAPVGLTASSVHWKVGEADTFYKTQIENTMEIS